MLTVSLTKPGTAVCGVHTGNFKSKWQYLFHCCHKHLVESQVQNKCIGVSSCVLQYEHSGLLVIPKRYSFLLENKMLYQTLYSKERKNVL